MAGVGFFCACSGNKSKELVNRISSADTVSTSIDTTAAVTPKLVKTADMRFKVKSVETTSRQITSLVRDVQGMVMHHRTSSFRINTADIRKNDDSVLRVSTLNTSGEMTVKIPTEKLVDFMDEVAKMGLYVDEQNLDISDKSLDYLSAQLKVQNRRELISQQKAGKIIIKNPVNVLNLKDEMTDQQISNRQIDDAVKNSVVNLSFYQSNTVFKETVVNDDPSIYKLPYFKRLADNIGYGWNIFGEMLLALVNVWVFIAAAIITWLLIRRYKRTQTPILVKS